MHALPTLRTTALLLLTLASAAAPASAPRDLDVSVPPGSPVDWSRAFPSITPHGGPLFPQTGGGQEPAEPGAERSSSVPAAEPEVGLDVQVSSSFALVRVLTWDLPAHLAWVRIHRELVPPPVSGASHPPLPRAGDALYWMSIAPFLRLMLHPEAVSRVETVVHLTEIGEPVLAVVGDAGRERGLWDTAREVEALIRPLRDAAAEPLRGDDARAGMRLRFVFDELTSRFAHDPVAGFGDRLFLFGDDFLEEVSAYTDNGNAFLRRNAVAALARYRSPEAVERLVELAGKSRDPVVQVRALAGIGRYRGRVDPAPLLERLQKTEDPVMLAALLSAIGRARIDEAVPRILELGEEALDEQDSEVLMPVLTALAEMRPSQGKKEVLKFVREVETAARSKPKDFRYRGERSTQAADMSDPVEMRATALQQLALLARARIETGDDRTARELLKLRHDTNDRGNGPTFRGTTTGDTLSRLVPAVRFLYLATLRELGDKGVKHLRTVALDSRSETALRGYALAQLPWEEQQEVVSEILEGGESAEVRIQAFEVAAAAKHPKLAEYGRTLLQRCAGLGEGGGRPEERYLGLAALRALGQRRLLKLEDLLPLVSLVKSDRNAFDQLPEEVRRLAVELVDRSSRGAQNSELERRIDALLDLVVDNRMNGALTEDTRTRDRKYVAGVLESARARREVAGYLELVVDELLAFLLGYREPTADHTRAEFAPRVLLEEEILLALGRTGDPRALDLLLSVLRNRRNRHRATACLALGVLGNERASRELATFLLDGDPFVRYCAYRSLARLTGHDLPVDWMYGPSKARTAAAEDYLRWIEGR
ncbi:MAG: HEAT repeat domain-containing protein [Planctomycetota bacterium]